MIDPRVEPGVVIKPGDDGLVRVVPPPGWPALKLGDGIALRDQDGLTVTYVVVGSDNGALLLRPPT